jgi:peroxiredoxin
VKGAVYTHAVKFLLVALSFLAAAAPAAPASGDPAATLSLMSPKPVKPAKDFRVSAPDNRPLTLADFKGKVVFLNFWATWCKPCEEEMPGMERLYQRYKDKGLVVLAISEDADGAGAVAPFVKKHRLTFPIGLDPKMTLAGAYGVWALPSTFIIDRQGNRAHFANGPREWDGPAARDFFESMLR